MRVEINKRNIKRLVLEELQRINFPSNTSRTNVNSTETKNLSFCMGDVNYRGQKFLQGRLRGPSKWNKKFPDLFLLVQRLIGLSHPNFEYTTIQINKNVLCKPHIDKNNVGPSYILALGDYEGGELNVEGSQFNIRNKWKKFNGLKAHWVENFTGDRYSLIFFTHTFKPPNASLRYLTITKQGIWNNEKLVRRY